MSHSRVSPSSFEQRRLCPGSLALEEAANKHSSSVYADEGTAAHQVLEWTLRSEGKRAHAYEGRLLRVVNGEVCDPGAATPPRLAGQTSDIINEFYADDAMCQHVQDVVDYVLDRVEHHRSLGAQVELHTERKVSTSPVYDLPDHYGTADVTIVAVYPGGCADVDILDLKYGAGHAVSAEGNAQLMSYGAAVVCELDLFYTVRDITLGIMQPRMDNYSLATVDYRDILAFIDEAKQVAAMAVAQADAYAVTPDASKLTLSASDDACRWCTAGLLCPLTTSNAMDVLLDEIEDLDAPAQSLQQVVERKTANAITLSPEALGAIYAALPAIERYTEAIRAAVEGELLAGRDVPGAKLVEGKKGNRAWISTTDAEAAMKSMRLTREEMYPPKLISPTQAEKLLKDNPRKWARLEALIHRSEGKPTVAPITDKRPPLPRDVYLVDLEEVPEELSAPITNPKVGDI